MVDINAAVKLGLSAIPSNVHKGRENITITFEWDTGDLLIEDGQIVVDEYKNPKTQKTTVVIQGVMKLARSVMRNVVAMGNDSSYPMIEVRITTVNGVATTKRPATIKNSMIGEAVYKDQHSERTVTGQFKVHEMPDFSVAEASERAGNLLYGQLEITGEAN